MCLGLPVIAYDVDFNRETTMNAAKYFDSVKKLVSIVQSITEGELNLMAKKINILQS